MDGIINVLKPPGMTSHDVVARIRRLTGVKKTGHTGTLDPGAAGVLPVCVGKATRVSEYVLGMDKSYRADLTLGTATDSEDAAGVVVDQKAVPELTEEQVAPALQQFLGPISQLPPMYSAVKIGGQKLYELARRGETVDREPRLVTVYSIRLVRLVPGKITFDVTCSRGTYIRTLCREIAESLGTVGHMSFLLRTAVGPFTLQGAHTLEELADTAKAGDWEHVLLPADTALLQFPSLVLQGDRETKIRNGMTVKTDLPAVEGTLVRVYGGDGHFLALGRATGHYIKPEKVFL